MAAELLCDLVLLLPDEAGLGPLGWEKPFGESEGGSGRLEENGRGHLED